MLVVFRLAHVLVQGKKVKRNKRVFKRQEERTAPVGRDGLAREFGAGDDFQGLEGVHQCPLLALFMLWRKCLHCIAPAFMFHIYVCVVPCRCEP